MKPCFRYISILYNGLLDSLFPESCLGCNKKGSPICDHCATTLRRAERETSRNIVAAFDYRDPIIKKAIWHLKYHNKRHLGQRLGTLLYESLLEEVSDMRSLSRGQPILVIPVPLSPHRKQVRGYNQAEILARHFSHQENSEVFKLRTDIIYKKKDTSPQAKITNRSLRLKNIRGAFEINENAIVRERTIIVIDDVTTTGGTITEITTLLKKRGAKKVIGFAVAH